MLAPGNKVTGHNATQRQLDDVAIAQCLPKMVVGILAVRHLTFIPGRCWVAVIVRVLARCVRCVLVL